MMTSRERVLRAIRHEKPDRLPVFKPNVINTYEPFEPRVQKFMDTFEFDRFVHPGGVQGGPVAKREIGPETTEDGYGCRYKYEGVGLPYCIHSPLAAAESAQQIESYAWPDSSAWRLPDGVRARARELHAAGEYVVAVGAGNLFHQYHYVRGFEQWMLDIKLNPDIHRAIADRIHQINKGMLLMLLEEVGDYVDIVVSGDDLGTSTAPYMSPDDFRTLVKPYFADLIGTIKSRWPHLLFYLHSHGQIMPLVPDLIECGVDVLNPILPLDRMDPRILKRDFGDALAFEGGIDIESILPFGTVTEVEEHVREVVSILAPGGGYLFKAQAISPIIPYENIIRAYELALEY